MSEMGTNSAVPLPVSLLQMMTGYWASQAIYAAAKLGVADLLAAGPRPIDELALASNTHAPSLKRLLRTLASTGIFTEIYPDVFALTSMAELLRTDTRESMRSLAIMYAEEQYQAWGDFLHSVQTGEPAFERHFGIPYFPYLSQHFEAGQVFNEAMTGWSAQLIDAVVNAYDFTTFQTIVDIAGGHGALLSGILKCSPNAKGILFELPEVVATAKEPLETAGVADRCTTVGGDFFKEIPSGGDVYILSQILHDWDDESSIEILRQIRRGIQANGKVLVIELYLPPGNEPSISKWLDLHMLVLTQGGRERTPAEYDALFRAAGFAQERVVPMNAPQCIVEGVPI